MTLKELIAEKLEEQADEVIDVYWRAGQNGEWRAVDALLDRYLGKPTQPVAATVEAAAPWTQWTPEQIAWYEPRKASVRELEHAEENGAA
jgi:hypothetical protein